MQPFPIFLFHLVVKGHVGRLSILSPPPSSYDFAEYCSESGLLFTHAITNSPYLLYSDTKMHFHLQNKI